MMTQQTKILNALRMAPDGITSRQMVEMGIYKYSSRIAELRAKGHKIVPHRVKGSLWRYTLEDWPTQQEVEALAGEFDPTPRQQALVEVPRIRRFMI